MRVTCTKRRYRTRVDALIALAAIQGRDDARRSKTESRAYRCPTCHGWHLTSRRPREEE